MTIVLLIFFSAFVVLNGPYPRLDSSSTSATQAYPETIDNPQQYSAENVPVESYVNGEVIAATPLIPDQINFAHTLYGTHIDGGLRADNHGNLILEIGVRDFFDYFLSAADELGAEAAIDEIVRYADTYLPTLANSQAKDVLRNYLRYKRFEMQLQQTPIHNAALTDKQTLKLLNQSFETLRQERQRLFSAEVDGALFGLEDAYADYTLNSMSIRLDDTLSDNQKEVKLNALSQNLPPQIASSQARFVEVSREQKRLKNIFSSSSDNAQVYDQLRSEGYTQGRIEQIISYRQQQLDFGKRYQAYISERNRLSVGDLSLDQLKQAKDKLRTQYFPLGEDQTRARLREIEAQ